MVASVIAQDRDADKAEQATTATSTTLLVTLESVARIVSKIELRWPSEQTEETQMKAELVEEQGAIAEIQAQLTGEQALLPGIETEVKEATTVDYEEIDSQNQSPGEEKKEIPLHQAANYVGQPEIDYQLEPDATVPTVEVGFEDGIPEYDPQLAIEVEEAAEEVINKNPAEMAHHLLNKLETDRYEGDYYTLFREGETLTVTAKDGRGEILSIQGTEVISHLNSQDLERFERGLEILDSAPEAAVPQQSDEELEA